MAAATVVSSCDALPKKMVIGGGRGFGPTRRTARVPPPASPSRGRSRRPRRAHSALFFICCLPFSSHSDVQTAPRPFILRTQFGIARIVETVSERTPAHSPIFRLPFSPPFASFRPLSYRTRVNARNAELSTATSLGFRALPFPLFAGCLTKRAQTPETLATKLFFVAPLRLFSPVVSQNARKRWHFFCPPRSPLFARCLTKRA